MPHKPHLCIILGIRPDVIRASIFLNLIREDSRVKVTFIWSGQHYSNNLKDIFFKEDNIPSLSSINNLFWQPLFNCFLMDVLTF